MTSIDPHGPATRRPVTFDHDKALNRDDFICHLNHPLADRAMRMLRKQIWASGSDVELARVTARYAPGIDAPSIVAVARLVLAAADGQRLHEEVIAAGGRIRDDRFRRWDTIAEVRAALNAAGPDPVPVDLVQPYADLWPSIEQQVFASLDVRGATVRTASPPSSRHSQRRTRPRSLPFLASSSGQSASGSARSSSSSRSTIPTKTTSKRLSATAKRSSGGSQRFRRKPR